MFQTIGQVAVYATILGVFITIAAWINGRRTTKEIKAIISELSEKLSEQIARVSEQIARVSEQIARVSDQIAHSEESTKQLLAKMDEKLNLLAKDKI